jgi:transcriptional regulator with XRE-family HTH domain
MCIVRIGEKVIDVGKVHREVDKVLMLRHEGKSQKEVANLVGVDRTFISRLERLGEIRKGESIAIIGFPVKNKKDIERLARKYGIEFTLIMSEQERWDFIEKSTGLEQFNRVLETLLELKRYDLVISLASDKRNELLRKLIDNEIICIDIGKSPLTNDIELDLNKLENIILNIMDRGNKIEKSS